MATFTISLQKTLAHEGGYVHDIDDTGGETYKGISRANHTNWSGWTIIDKHKDKQDFPVRLDNDLELQKQIRQFYHANFWMSLKAGSIENQSIADSVFDFAVNTGINASIRIVQSITGAKIDGIVGQKTLKVLNAVEPDYFLMVFTLTKIKYYISIIKKR
ncbi:glycosyl hydrolase 108 family protein [Paludibacter sp.]